MDLNESFPIHYRVRFKCSKISLEETINKTASFVSEVYAIFAKLDKRERKKFFKQWIAFEKFDENCERPTKAECERFKEVLKQKIVTSLNDDDYGKPSIFLTTDIGPEKALLEVCETAFQRITQSAYHYRTGGAFTYLFPYQTCTSITISKTKLCLDMDFENTNIL